MPWETETKQYERSMQSHSPVVQPWWCESCVRTVRWSWQTGFLGQTRPAYSQGPRWQAPWRQDPSALPRFHWLAGVVASVPLERLERVRTGQPYFITPIVMFCLTSVWGILNALNFETKVPIIWGSGGCKEEYWQIGLMKSLPNYLLATSVCNVHMHVHTTIRGLVWYRRKVKNMTILRQGLDSYGASLFSVISK